MTALTLQELPPRILDYIGSSFATAKNLKIMDRYHLSEQQLSALASTIGDVFLKEFLVSDLPNVLKSNLRIDPGVAFLISADVYQDHLAQWLDYFEPVPEKIVDNWRQWGRELGARPRDTKAQPAIERLLAQTQPKVEKTRLEFSKVKKVEPQKKAPTVPKRHTSGTVGQKIAEKRAAEHAAETQPQVQANQPQVSPEARERFLSQLRGLTIDALREGGQSAATRLQQAQQKIGQVLASAPGDRAMVSQALRQSPLFATYQQLGQEVIRSGQPIDMVIYQRYQQGQPYLLRDEFDSVASLIKLVG